jgi:hypothetical protein
MVLRNKGLVYHLEGEMCVTSENRIARLHNLLHYL